MNGSLLPWKVTVHFQNFPVDKLIKTQAVDICKDYFMAMIKEVRCCLTQLRFAAAVSFSTAGQIMTWKNDVKSERRGRIIFFFCCFAPIY